MPARGLRLAAALAVAGAALSGGIVRADEPGGTAAPMTQPTYRPDPSLPAVHVDSHVHVHSPAILAFLPGYCASPGRIGACPEVFTLPYTPEQLIAQMDSAGIQRALVMSSAYLAESPMMQPPVENHAQIVREANSWTVDLARRYPDRIGAYIGIDPITDTALPEIAHWAHDPHVSGIKLHLTNSDVDLRNPRHVRKLAAVFAAARKAHLAIMIHMRTRQPDYGARDVQIFLRDVLPSAGDTPVQIAHAAGWGGIDAQTLSALGAFADAIDARPAIARHLTFDLAAVWKATTPESDLESMAALIHRIGAQHFVPASDFPFTGDLEPYYDKTYPRLPLSAEEWSTIRGNTPEYARADWPRKRLKR